MSREAPYSSGSFRPPGRRRSFPEKVTMRAYRQVPWEWRNWLARLVVIFLLGVCAGGAGGMLISPDWEEIETRW
jgi:hypothetical protein